MTLSATLSHAEDRAPCVSPPVLTQFHLFMGQFKILMIHHCVHHYLVSVTVSDFLFLLSISGRKETKNASMFLPFLSLISILSIILVPARVTITQCNWTECIVFKRVAVTVWGKGQSAVASKCQSKTASLKLVNGRDLGSTNRNLFKAGLSRTRW